MASSPQAGPEPALAPATPRAMSRCECAGISFEDVARRLRDTGCDVEDICRRTGCGRTCTACLPDLARFLATR
jgi:NAD(P)H-nitrite reductase large subunit